MGIKIDRSNIDEYYELINKKIDHYFEKNVSPDALFKYFSKDYGLEKFIKREDLSDVENIKKIIMDVVEDRMALNEEILTFEQYGNGPNKFGVMFDITMDLKKKIADLYRVSLGHIENKKNRIKLKGVKNEQELFVFDKETYRKVFLNISENMYKIFMSENVFEYMPLGIKMDINKLDIDKESFISSFYSNIYGKHELVEELLYNETGEEFSYKKIDDDTIIIFEKL